MTRFTNQAQLRYGNSVTNSNVAVGEILEVLSATKTAIQDTYRQDDRITYMINIINSGNTAFTGLTIQDNLGAYPFQTGTLQPLDYIPDTVNYFANGVQGANPTVETTSGLTITGITVPANGNATVVYEAMVNDYAPLNAGSTIDNTATLTGPGGTSLTMKATIVAEPSPLLSIMKSVSPVPVAENGTLTYTFLIQNTGGTDADTATGVTVTDTFNPILINPTVTLDGTAMQEGTDYTYTEATGAFASVAGAITVPKASYEQDSATGVWTITPGVSTLVISGDI